MMNLIENLGGGGRANGLWRGGRKGPLAIVGSGRGPMKGPKKGLVKNLTERRQGPGSAPWIWAGIGLLVAAGVAFNLKELIRYIKIARM
jgi:hypothetical protein